MAIPIPKKPVNRPSESSSLTRKTIPSSMSEKKSPIKDTKTPTAVSSPIRKSVSSQSGSSFSSRPSVPTPPSRKHTHHTHTSQGNGLLSTLISLLIIVGILFFAWTNKDIILNYLEQYGLRGSSDIIVSSGNQLFVGQELTLRGIPVTTSSPQYTHRLETIDYGTIGLRSSVLDLSSLSGEMEFHGTVVDFAQNMYIFEVSSVQAPVQVQQSGQIMDDITYIAPIGLILAGLSQDNFQLQGGGQGGQDALVINNTLTNASVVVRYFACSTTPSRDCKRFSESFQSTVGIDFVDSFGNVFYRLKDANTRFVSLDNRVGMYFETTDPTILPLVIKHMQFVTNEWIKKTYTQTAPSLCQSETTVLKSVQTTELVYHDGEIAAKVTGLSQNATPVQCLIAIDPTHSLAGKVISFSDENGAIATGETQNLLPTETPSETPTVTPTQTTQPLTASSTPQFALRPGKEIKFTTNRGVTLVFPNPAVSYNSFIPTETIAGLKCTLGVRVVDYKTKENLTTSPDVIVYMCPIGTPSLDSTMTSFSTAMATYVVKVYNPAWVDFANNIRVE